MTSTARGSTAETGSGHRPPSGARIRWRWRVVDIVTASVLGAAFGFVFLAWNAVYKGPSDLLTPLLPGVQGLLVGPWLIAGVVGGLVIRKPGAAIYVETLAAVVSALAGTTWGGLLTVEAGIVQGIGAELVLLAFLYRGHIAAAALAGAGAGIAEAINDLVLWYRGSTPLFATVYAISCALSGLAVAGVLGWLLVRALAATGALARFPVGRERRAPA